MKKLEYLAGLNGFDLPKEEQNYCKYIGKCGQDYDQNRCAEKYRNCLVYQRMKILENRTQ